MLQIRLFIMLEMGVLGMSEYRAVKRWNKSTKDLVPLVGLNSSIFSSLMLC